MKQAAELAAKAGTILPAFANAPELLRGLELYVEAWGDLGTERQYLQNGQPLPIPHSKIIRYARQWLSLGRDHQQHFAEVIRLVDNWHLEETAKRIEENGKKLKKPAPLSRFRG